MKRIQSGDTVIVTTGKSKGHVDIVQKVIDDKVIVQGANIVNKHVKANPQANEQGGIKKIEKPLHISNVALYNPITNKADKVGFKITEDNKKVRYFKSNGELVDVA